MNSFSEKYKELSSLELVRIIENSDDYQPTAVEAASQELTTRKLTDNEFTAAKQELQMQRLEQVQKENQRRERFSKYQKLLKPIDPEKPAVHKLILSISLVFGILSLFQIMSQLELLQLIFTEFESAFDFYFFTFAIPLLWLPIAVVLFWLRRKSGWLMLATLLSYRTTELLLIFVMSLRATAPRAGGLSSIFLQPSLSNQALVLILLSGTLMIIAKKEVRKVYRVDRQGMFAAIGLGIILISLIIISLR